jgi:hypothetical protein
MTAATTESHTANCDVCGTTVSEHNLALLWQDTDFVKCDRSDHYIGLEPTPANFAAMRAAKL